VATEGESSEIKFGGMGGGGGRASPIDVRRHPAVTWLGPCFQFHWATHVQAS
jgi:hypothetical protein